MEIIDLNEEDELIELNNKEMADTVIHKGRGRKEKGNRNNDDREDEPSALGELVSWIMYFAVAIIIALFLKTFVIINATVPTGSMENTIMTNDCIMGLRLAYTISEPKRGDIIVFKYPDDETQKYVKRIIGLPGDNIYIENGEIYINGSVTPYQESYLKEDWVIANGPYEFQVPEDSYLVLGDNRNNSLDARYWTNKYVTKDKIIGKALFVYFPFSRLGAIN